MSKNPQLLMSYKLLALLFCCIFHFSLGDVGTAATYSPPYTPTACYGNDASQFPSSNLFVAAGDGIWDNGAACGRQYKVRCISATVPRTCIPNKTIQIRIVDRAQTSTSKPTRAGTTMILTTTAYGTIANGSPASINIEFQEMSKKTQLPMSYILVTLIPILLSKIFVINSVMMSKKTQLPMSYILVTLLLAQLFHFSLADVGTAAAYSPPYTLMLGLLWGVSGALEMRDLDSDGSGAQLWLACIVGRFRVWLTSILACRLNRRRRGLGHSSLLKWVPFGTLIANVSATCVMAAFATLMKVEGFTALIEMMVSKFGRDGASFTRGRAATKKLIKGFAHWWNREKKNKPKEKRSGRDGQATSDHNHGVVDSASLSTTSTHGNHVQFCYSIWAIACILLYPATAEAVPDSSYNQDAAIKLAYGVDLGSQLATPPPLPPVQPPSPPPIDGSPIPPSSAPPQSKPKFRRPPPPPPLRNEPAQKPGAVNLVLVLGVAIPVGALVIVAVVIVVVVVVKMQTPASTTTTIHDPIPTSQPTEINLHEITTSTNPTETTTTPTEFVAATNIVGGSGSNTLDEGEAEVQMYPVVPSTPVARPKIKGKRMVMN